MNLNSSELNRIKLNNGVGPLKSFYHDLLMNDPKKAVSLINDEDLHFSSLFILKSEIKKFNLYSHLSNRNKNALKLANQILERNKINFGKLSKNELQDTYILLKWMIESGYQDDGINNQFDEVLDIAAILLIKIFLDKSILNIIIELIFTRNKKKTFNYDLIWALFESHDPIFLFEIAKRLFSSHWMDIELARKILKFIPEIESTYSKNSLQQYNHANKWLTENLPFLYYTGECFHQSCNPKPFKLSLEAKYICNPAVAGMPNTQRGLTEKEQALLSSFSGLSSNIKNILSRYSYSIYRQNINWWNAWINYPVSEQIKFAKNVGGLQ